MITAARSALAALLAVAALALGACERNEALARDQIVLVDDAELARMAEPAWRELLASKPVSDDPEANRRVGEVGSRIAQAAGLGDRRWEYVVLADPAPNAVVLPGQKVAVNTGVLQLAATDGQLAAVLGHEVAHVAARHAGERVSQGALAQAGVNAAGSILGDGDPDQARAIAGALGLGVEVGVINRYSRRHELEADRIGLDYMARAGYRPSEALAFWERMAEVAGSDPLPFLSTHPPSAERIEAIRTHIAERDYR